MSTAPTASDSAIWEWRHPEPTTRFFEAVQDGVVRGTLRFSNLLGSRAEGTIDGETWHLHRVGIFRPRIDLRRSGTHEDAPPDATIAISFAGAGVLRRPGAGELQWNLTDPAMNTMWGWLDDTTPLVTFEPTASDDGLIASLIQLQGRATVTAAAAGRDDLPFLVLVGWYLTAAQQFDLVANPPSF